MTFIFCVERPLSRRAAAVLQRQRRVDCCRGPVAAGHERLVWSTRNSRQRTAIYPTTIATRFVPKAVVPLQEKYHPTDRPSIFRIARTAATPILGRSLSLRRKGKSL